jgi:hypothetical protein
MLEYMMTSFPIAGWPLATINSPRRAGVEHDIMLATVKDGREADVRGVSRDGPL